MNPIVCGSCQTENPGDADFCEGCGAPLTQSAEAEVMEGQAAMDHGTFGDRPLSTTPESGHVPGTDTTVREGLPTD